MKKYLKNGHDDVKARQQNIKRHAGGRPKVVTDEMKDALITVIKNGLTPTEAASALGLSKAWLQTEVNRYPEFEIQVNMAIEKFKLFHINNIQKFCKNSWQASAWLLERTFPERFNARVAQEAVNKVKEKSAPSWFGSDIEDAVVLEDEEVVEVRHKRKSDYIAEKREYSSEPFKKNISDEEAVLIRKEYARSKIPYSRLAERYGVSKTTISKVINKQSHKNA